MPDLTESMSAPYGVLVMRHVREVVSVDREAIKAEILVADRMCCYTLAKVIATHAPETAPLLSVPWMPQGLLGEWVRRHQYELAERQRWAPQ